MEIEKVKIEELKMYENNAKQHPLWQIEEIKKSIQEYGYNDLITIDEKNVILEGHGRYLALKDLGYVEIEVSRINHLNDMQKKAYILAHNKLTINTGFDEEILIPEIKAIALDKLEIDEIDMEEMEIEDIDIPEIIGFTEMEIKELLSEDDNVLDIEEDVETEVVPQTERVILYRCPECGHKGNLNEFAE